MVSQNTVLIGAIIIVGLFATGFLTPAGVAPSVGTSEVAGICPDTGLVDIRVATFNDEDPDKAQVASKASVFLKGQATPVETITTATSGVASSTTDLDCGSDYSIVFGHTDESNYYEEWVEDLNTGNSATNTHKFAVKKVGGVTVTASNETTQGVSSPISLTLGAGEDSSDVVIKLKESAVDSWFGKGESLICFDYSTADYTTIEVVEGTVEVVPTLASANEKCWKVSTPGLVDFGSHEFTMFVDTKDGVNPNATSGNFTVNVYDYQNFEYLGNKFWTIEDPADNSAIGATDGSYTVNVL